MDKEVLERWIAEGRSLQWIGEQVGRHPSTVSYWLRKYGLVPAHRDRHAARGGVAREQLVELVEAGLSGRAIGERLGLTQASVRRRLGVYGLETRRTARNRALGEARAAGAAERVLVCDRHGATRHVRVAGRGFRCAECRSEAVIARRRRVKALLVEEAGGACVLCGYDRCLQALQFHHRDPATKDFHVAHRGAARSIERARAEVAKCVLLCANCHAEVEAGAAKLPDVAADQPA